MQNRWYNPAADQFLEQDPILQNGGQSNFRDYVGNDWANETDPSGLKVFGFGSSPAERRESAIALATWIAGLLNKDEYGFEINDAGEIRFSDQTKEQIQALIDKQQKLGLSDSQVELLQACIGNDYYRYVRTQNGQLQAAGVNKVFGPFSVSLDKQSGGHIPVLSTAGDSVRAYENGDALRGNIGSLVAAAEGVGIAVASRYIYQLGSALFAAPNRLPPITQPTNRGGLRQAMGQPPAGMTNPNAHHDLPWTFRDWFAQRGLNVNDPRFGRWVEGTPPGGHQRWSAAFDAEWRQFKDRFPNATADDVIAFMNRLRSDPRFQ
jgi:hypothetical protein